MTTSTDFDDGCHNYNFFEYEYDFTGDYGHYYDVE
jgi:hypothetical protein